MITTTEKQTKIPQRIDLLDTSFEESLFLDIAGQAQTGEIDRLRQTAYASASNFELPDKQTILCRRDPADAVCLTIGTRQRIAATMRIALATDRARAEYLLEGTAELPPSFFPGVVLSRGATDPQFRGNGLMSFLVALGVEVARQCAIGSALGVQVEGTPHFAAMEAAAWRSRAISDGDLALVRNTRPLMLVYIGKDDFHRSVEHSRHTHRRLHTKLRPERVVREAALLLEKHRR